MVNPNKKYTKRIVYRAKKAKLVISRKEENPYGPRVKSAPQISIPKVEIDVEQKAEEKKYVIFKADGTPLTIDDLTDSSSSDDTEEQIIDEVIQKNEDKDTQKKEEDNQGTKETVEEVYSNSPTTVVAESKASNKDISISFLKHPCCHRYQIIDEERSEMLEDLLKSFPPTQPSVDKKITIADILRCEERTPFDLKLIKKGKKKTSTYIIDKNRKDTVVELARLELNKLTSVNFKVVLSKLKSLDIKKVEEAKEIANIVLDKAISEPTFTQVYARAVGELKKVLKSKEEQNMNVKQTAFFGTLLTRAFAIVCEKVQWADPNFEIHLSDFANRILYEEKIEESEEQRYKKKKRTMGAINFVSHLYIENIISYTKIGERIDQLMKDPHYESVEVLCAFISNIGEKLMMSNKEQIVTRVFNYLSAIKNKYELRIQFLIEATFENRKKWKKPVVQGATNRFSSLEIEEVEVPKVEIKKEEVNEDAKILSFVSSIYSELQDCFEDEEKVVIADSFSRGVKLFGPKKFFSIYLSEAISDFKKSKFILPFFVDFFDRTSISNPTLVEYLSDLRENLKELKIDFPISASNYVELICLLRIRNILSPQQFNDLKSSDYPSKIKEIISKWNKSGEMKDKVAELE